MSTIEDAAKLNVQERTTFYVSAFLFQAWISVLTLANAAQFAEKTNPDGRSFQTGQAWRGFLNYFGKAPDVEFPDLFGHLMQFAEYDDPLAAHLFDAIVPLSIEHDLTGNFLGKHTAPVLGNHPKDLLALMRSTATRLCEWLDAILQIRVFQEWHFIPNCFDPDPQQRELGYLAFNRRHFGEMSEKSKLHYLEHLADVAQELKHSPKWAAYRQAASGPLSEPRPWPTEALDLAIIKLWPLFIRYRWSGTDLFWALGQVLKPGDLAACPNEAALAAHCTKTLCLRCARLDSIRRQRPEPRAYAVARRLCAPKHPDNHNNEPHST
jgi:hypothetical protein